MESVGKLPQVSMIMMMTIDDGFLDDNARRLIHGRLVHVFH